MSEFYEYESSCTRCIRSSPLASLLAMVIVFLGGTAFGVGTIFGRKRLYELLEVDHLFPYLDFTVYAIVGATGLFVVIVYIICAVSSGWNAKRCFEGTRATCCGRCLNSTFLTCLIIAVIFWLLVSCLLAYPVTSMALLLYRSEGPARSVNAGNEVVHRAAREAVVDEDFFNPARPLTPPTGGIDHGMALEPSLAAAAQGAVIQPRVGAAGINVDPSAIIADYFQSDPKMLDLSYYGLYNKNGTPLLMDAAGLNMTIRQPLIFCCVAFLGALITTIGFLFLSICVGMNFARLKEHRYYDPADNDDGSHHVRY